jgi:hypothetical protein
MDHFIVKIKFGIAKYQFFYTVSAFHERSIKFVYKIQPVSFRWEGNDTGLVNINFHVLSSASTTNRIVSDWTKELPGRIKLFIQDATVFLETFLSSAKEQQSKNLTVLHKSLIKCL